jgi:Cd2+/Zn2+-exporting ATPase
MLTGDRTESARAIAVQCKLDEYRAQLLPQDKVVCFEEYKQQAAATNVNISKKGKVVFVGDGINDAPVLAGADIGIAMGGIGSDAAIEAADVVIMNDNPLKIASAIIIARRTKRIVIQNIVFALAVKLLIMIFALFGISSIWFAIFADVGVALLALLNAMRAMYINSEK